GPARKGLRALESAARALGQGQIDVRADDRGGDEVSVLARTFNGMAAELQARSVPPAAARALGQGQIDVRADDRGGDEVSVLARTFNGMAAELQARSIALAASDRARRQLLADGPHRLLKPLRAI